MHLSKLLFTPIVISALVLITNPAQAQQHVTQAQHRTKSAAGCTCKAVRHTVGTSVVVRKPAVRTTVVYASPMIATRVVVPPYRSSESFYVVHPPVNLGSDLWVGSPINVYPSVPVASSGYSAVAVTPAPVRVLPVGAGGMSFNITPTFARIYVDDTYVGTAADFAAINTPLILSPGPHRVKIKADDYKTMKFNTEIVPGQIVPYGGIMQSRKFWDIL